MLWLDADCFVAFDEASEAGCDVCIAKRKGNGECCAAGVDVDLGCRLVRRSAGPVDGNEDALIGCFAGWCERS